MINTIIFSRKRPMQLWALLESLPVFCKPVIIVRIDEEYKENYQQVIQQFPNVTWVYEANFQSDTLAMLHTVYPYSMFLTDDCVFYRSVNNFEDVGYNETFSFRYGLNTTLQNHVINQYQPSLNNYVDKQDYIMWTTDHYQYPLNYAYSMALDGHVYTSGKLLGLCQRCNFNNSNSLEGQLQQFRSEIRIIKSHHKSSLVCVPCNNLSGITNAGKYNAYSPEYLNSLFSQGKRIDIDKTFENINIVGSHQELELKFKEN